MSDINLTEKRFEKESLEYHSMGRKGKIEVIPTKPFTTQKDLSVCIYSRCSISLS